MTFCLRAESIFRPRIGASRPVCPVSFVLCHARLYLTRPLVGSWGNPSVPTLLRFPNDSPSGAPPRMGGAVVVASIPPLSFLRWRGPLGGEPPAHREGAQPLYGRGAPQGEAPEAEERQTLTPHSSATAPSPNPSPAVLCSQQLCSYCGNAGFGCPISHFEYSFPKNDIFFLNDADVKKIRSQIFQSLLPLARRYCANSLSESQTF